MAKKNELAVTAKDFNLMTLEGDLVEAIAEEMEGLGTIPFDRVKIPSGGGLAFELPGEDEDDTESATELVGVILDHNPVNAYWRDKYTGGNEQPDCSSYDGKKGIDRETGEIKDCANCPYNQFGSDGDGKACKNVHRLYILREGNPVPLILSLPPTSLRYFRDYIAKKVLLKGYRCYQVITRITLKKDKNKSGIVYSRAAFSFACALEPEQAAGAEKMKELITSTYRNLDIDGDDYNTSSGQGSQTAPPAGKDGFMDIPDKEGEELPFN